MTTLLVPPLDKRKWPTLGPQVCDFIEERLVFGPGDLRGRPALLDDEKRALVYRMYEVYPRDHAQAGRRRFKRVALSLRKGVAKTEFAAWIAACELHPEAPVRCDGWKRTGSRWDPVGIGVADPYIPMVAYTEEQTEDLAYYALLTILAEGPLADDFDIGLERIMRIRGDGKAVALAGAPNARDGARTTFQHFDETHRFTLPRLIAAHQTMQANLPKRKAADAWSLETTTAYVPGEGSLAERTMTYARSVAEGKASEPTLFFFHRQAGDEHDLSTEEGARAAVLEASGATAEWSDIDGIVGLWADPTTDRNYWERVWTNRPTGSATAWLPYGSWDKLAAPKRTVSEKAEVVLAFYGAYDRSSTALVACTLERPHVVLLGSWEQPAHERKWRVPVREVMDAVTDAMETYKALEFAPSPIGWRAEVEAWEDTYGATCVRFETNRTSMWGPVCDEFYQAVADEALTHDGSPVFAAHMAQTSPVTRSGYSVLASPAPAAAAAAVIAYSRARWRVSQPQPRSAYAERGLLTV